MQVEIVAGELTCTCPAGTRTTESDRCVQCELGTFTERGGLTECRICPAGATTLRLGADSADECVCPPHSSPSSERGGCECDAGYTGVLSKPGDECLPCSIGSFKPLIGPALCDTCPPGSTTADVATLSEADCQCVPGSYPQYVEGAMECSSCPAGANCTTGGAPTGMQGYWRDNMSLPVFYACPFPSACLPEHAPRGSGGNSDAAARRRLLEIESSPPPLDAIWADYPGAGAYGNGAVGAFMGGYGNDVEEDAATPILSTNRAPPPPAPIPRASHAPLDYPSWRCDYGYMGMLCAVCEPGYGFSETDGCASCEASGTVWVGAVAGAIALALVVVLLYWLPFLPRLDAAVGAIVGAMASWFASNAIGSADPMSRLDTDARPRRSSRSVPKALARSLTGAKKAAMDGLQATSDAASHNIKAALEDARDAVDDAAALSRQVSRAASEAVSEATLAARKRAERSTAAAHVRVLIAFVQVVATVNITFDIPWPREFLDFVEALRIINLDVLSLPSTRCSLESWDFFDKLWLWMCAPAAFLAASLLLYGAGRLYAGDRLGSRLVRFRANVWRNTLFVLFLVYPMLSATLLKTFHCREVDGARWLSSDMRLQCDTATHREAMVVAFAGLALYVAGIPLFFLLSMLRHRVPAIAERHRSRRIARNALFAGIARNEDADEIDAVLGRDMRRLLNERATVDRLVESGVASKLLAMLEPPEEEPPADKSGSGDTHKAKQSHEDIRDALVAWVAANVPIGQLSFDADPRVGDIGADGVDEASVSSAAASNAEVDADEATAVRHCGQLFASYQTECWYWELVELLRKLVLTGALVFVDSGGSGQIAVGLLVAGFFLVGNLALSPYADPSVDRSAQAALIEIVLILFAGLLVKVETVEGTNDRKVIGALLLVTSCAVFVTPVLSALLTHGAAVWHAARRRMGGRAKVATSWGG